MPSNTDITVAQLSRLIGLPNAPTIIDVRDDEDYAADPRVLPCTLKRDWDKAAQWIAAWNPPAGTRAVVVCQKGLKLSEGVAALMRARGIAAEVLEGGYLAWRDAGGLLLSPAQLPLRGSKGWTRG